MSPSPPAVSQSLGAGVRGRRNVRLWSISICLNTPRWVISRDHLDPDITISLSAVSGLWLVTGPHTRGSDWSPSGWSVHSFFSRHSRVSQIVDKNSITFVGMETLWQIISLNCKKLETWPGSLDNVILLLTWSVFINISIVAIIEKKLPAHCLLPAYPTWHVLTTRALSRHVCVMSTFCEVCLILTNKYVHTFI